MAKDVGVSINNVDLKVSKLMKTGYKRILYLCCIAILFTSSLFLFQNTAKATKLIEDLLVSNFAKCSSTRMRNLILISLDWTRPKDPPLSLGHASILSNLRHHHINVREHSWAVNDPNFSPHHVSNFIMKNLKDSHTDVALGTFVWNEKSIQTILNDLKKHQFPGRIILGGPQISYVKKGLEEFYPQADVFIRGYAENPLAELMKSDMDSLPSIKGVHYARQFDLGLSASAELDDLPSPFLTGLIKPQRFIRWETQRGCPFRCAFCQHRESDTFIKRRQFPLSRILQEAE